MTSPIPALDPEARLAARIASGAVTLPMLPEVPRRLASAASSDATDARSLAELIRRDPGVAGQLLRVANSAAFGGVVRIVSLQQAIARLGLDAVRRIALAIAVEAQVFRVPGFEAPVRAQFDLALAAAWFAQELARIRRLPVEEAFLAGLFHDLGRPAVIQAAVAEGVPRAQVLTLAERYYAAVGARIAADWELSPRLVAVARHHHAPADAADAAALCQLVLLADAMASTVLAGAAVAPTAADLPVPAPVIAALGLYPDDLDRLLARADTVRALVQGVG